MKVCVGGSFNILHKGHRRLLAEAVHNAGSDGFLFIGLASGELVAQKKDLRSFEKRRQAIIDLLSQQKNIPMIVIASIQDRFGPTLKYDFDVIVVSPETISVAREINRIRQEKGKKQMKIVQIPFILADDGKPISSTRISEGKITKEGKIPSKETKESSD